MVHLYIYHSSHFVPLASASSCMVPEVTPSRAAFLWASLPEETLRSEKLVRQMTVAVSIVMLGANTDTQL